ncbi:pseudouridine synthase [Pseudoclavibacter sp. 13-3]|uniref:pseudouridine synthase n=1 Tax=Pseudoclavibacter sp. 13-3 TaxID=2901228 RepID=UPI001E523033|nr:pseudouridine synthase [Pseudoclavibacter sp. 13-3]MCD7101408.1 pseudouridine synthase [Pseudoclavibacter sp. 13-3]
MPSAPFAPRDGVSATRVITPPPVRQTRHAGQTSSRTIGEWLRLRFPASVDVDEALEAGRYVYADGRTVIATDEYRPRTEIWFERDLPDETEVPGAIRIVHRDARLIVIDKPPFLATIPRGRHVRQTVVTRLRSELGLPELQPVHRLDRLTSGLVVLTTERRWRGAYQTLFQRREVHKVYQALAQLSVKRTSQRSGARVALMPLDRGEPRRFEDGAARPAWTIGALVEVRSRIEKRRGRWQAEELPGEVNAISCIVLERMLGGAGDECVSEELHGAGASRGGADGGIAGVGVFRLEPSTGRTHQLRVHMNRLGAPILGDPLYPVVREAWPGGPPADDFAQPLQLLAAELSFTDPVDGAARHFEAQRKLPISSQERR